VLSIALLAAAAAAGAGVAAALVIGLRHDPAPRLTTVVEKRPAPRRPDAALLNDAAFYLLTAKQYARALPLAQEAMLTSPRTSTTYGYATFNYGWALLELGRCADALPVLRRALRLEAPAQRHLIRPRITQAEACSRRAASSPGH